MLNLVGVILVITLQCFLVHKIVAGKCVFPEDLQGKWHYTDRMVKTVIVQPHSMAFYDGEFREPWVTMDCYKRSGDIYLLWAPKLFSITNIDAVFCIRLSRKVRGTIYTVGVPRGRRTFLEQIRLTSDNPTIKSDCLDVLMGDTDQHYMYRKTLDDKQ